MIKKSIKKVVLMVLIAAAVASTAVFPAFADETEGSVSVDLEMSEEDQAALNSMMQFFLKMMTLQPVEETEGEVTYTGAGSTITFMDKSVSDLSCLIDIVDEESGTKMVILSDSLTNDLAGSSEESEITAETPMTHTLLMANQPYDPTSGINYTEALKETVTNGFKTEDVAPIDMQVVDFVKDGIDYNLYSFAQIVDVDGETTSYFGYAAEYIQDGTRYVVALSGSGTPSVTFEDFKNGLGGYDASGLTSSSRTDLDMTPFLDESIIDQTSIQSMIDRFNGKASE